MNEPSSSADSFGQIADQFVAAFRQGQRPSVEDYAQRYPKHAEAIREMLPALVLMEKAKSADEAPNRPSPQGPHSATDLGALRELGDYRLLREIGRGGMGIVYEAEQVSLGRRVALKVLSQQMAADAKHRSRFQREAKAAAKLHHTNVVPVYGVGEQDGVLYYVMEFIQGLGLDEVIDELKRLQRASGVPASAPLPSELQVSPQEVSAAAVAQSLLSGHFGPSTGPDAVRAVSPEGTVDQPAEAAAAGPALREPGPAPSPTRSLRVSDNSTRSSSGGGRKQSYWRSVARLGMQVADALAYAHGQGVVHRDIKPSNLLLDTRGTVWVTDFGLAKMDDQYHLTETGDILGTLRYLPPEAFDGQRDARGDVYALGLTLYELLALQPAFVEKDRNCLIKKVRSEDPVRLRKLQPEIPRDLETIVYKATDKEPAHRYPTAGSLAEDLRLFLADRPIQARRSGILDRLLKWARRRPAAAALVVVSVLAVVSLLAGALWHNAHLQVAKQIAEDQRTQAQHERQQAVTHMYHALVGGARALRQARESGYRGQAWRLLHQALQLETPDKDRLELRQEAAACLGDFVGLEPTTWADFEANIFSVAFHPDGGQLALGLADGTVLLRKVSSGTEIARLKGHRSLGQALSFDRGSWYQGVLQGTVPDHLTLGQALSFTPDGSSLVRGTVDGTIEVWKRNDTEAWTRTKTMTLEPLLLALTPSPGFPFFVPSFTVPRISSIAISLDGNQVAALSRVDATIVVSKLRDGTTAVRFRAPGEERVWKVVLSPNGELVAGGYVHHGSSGDRSSGILVWEVATGQFKMVLPRGLRAVADLVFSPDSKLLACVHGGEGVDLYDTSTFERHLFVRGDFPSSVAFSPDNQLVAIPAPQRNVIRVWNIATNREVAVLQHPARAYLLRFSPDGKVLIATDFHSVRIWILTGAGEKLVLPGHAGGVPNVAFSPDGKLLASAGKDRRVKIWNGVTGMFIKELPDFPSPLQSVGFSPDGRMLAAADFQTGTIRIYEVGSWRELAAPPPESAQAIWSVSFSPDGKYFAAGGRGGLTIWRVVPGALSLQRFARLSERNSARFCFSPDSNLLAWRHYDDLTTTIHLWDTRNAQPRTISAARLDTMSKLAFYPDSKHLAFVSDQGAIEVWDVSTGQRALSFGGGEIERRGGLTQAGSHTALSDDGAWYAVARQAITIWDMQGQKLLLALPDERGTVWSLAWSPNKERLAVGTSDGGLVLWNLPTIKAQLAEIGLDW